MKARYINPYILKRNRAVISAVRDGDIEPFRQWADKITSGEYQEVKHGHWVRRPLDHFYPCHCSECGEVSESSNYNFCPNCGAIMDGGENDE